MTKKYLSVLLAAVLMASLFSACAQQKGGGEAHTLVTETTTAIATDTTGFKLSYSQSDSLNPYRTKTLNNQVVETLVFDSLFVPDDNFEAQPSIAMGYAYENGTTLNVTITSGILFSNGKKLTAKSVVHSFNEAKSSPHWKKMLSPISSASAVSDTVVKFTLAYQNPNAHNLLTFAISNGDTDKNGYPIGSGRYKFDEGDGAVFLTVNEKHADFAPHFTKIPLVNITSEESIENAINIGNISYAYRDLSKDADVKMQCNKKAVNLTNLVYIGINGNTGITKDENIRRAISLAVDRDTLVKSAYRGYGRSTTSPFHPASKLGKQSSVFSTKADAAAAKQAITQSGYKAKELKLDILVNKNKERYAAAKLIKQQLEAAGFSVTINREKNKTYRSKISGGGYDLYIGETRIPNDMNMRSFFTKNGATRYGINLKSSKTAKTYSNYLNKGEEIGSFVLAFSQEMPFVPLLYRQGMICYSKALQGDMQGSAENYFSNIEDWYYN
ncbi:MAG: ABC transporter substrate-binding protein [Ruminococcaceae bacterium]|nr:ABC transporter substrate-binding protein [Oscillospiraceae bacterium]